jgi:multisubunit Na+/H+ antiporter MnhE subunit
MRFARGMSFWLLAWLASAALWMLLVDSVRLAELVAGAAVAALAATAFEIVRRQRLAAQALRPLLALRIWRVVMRAVPDVGRLTRAAFAQVIRPQPVRGRVLAMPFGHIEDDADARALRAVAVGLGSIAPNTVVIGVDPDSGLLLVHQLEPTGRPSDLDPLQLR